MNFIIFCFLSKKKNKKKKEWKHWCVGQSCLDFLSSYGVEKKDSERFRPVQSIPGVAIESRNNLSIISQLRNSIGFQAFKSRDILPNEDPSIGLLEKHFHIWAGSNVIQNQGNRSL